MNLDLPKKSVKTPVTQTLIQTELMTVLHCREHGMVGVKMPPLSSLKPGAALGEFPTSTKRWELLHCEWVWKQLKVSKIRDKEGPH